MLRYLLYKLDAETIIKKILDKNTEEQLVLDFSNRTRMGLEDVILSVDTHSDNAMFYQIKKCMEQPGQSINFVQKLKDWNEYSLRDTMFYLDFSHVFPIEKFASMYYMWTYGTDEKQKMENIEHCTKILKQFFETGFRVLYGENQEGICFVPFEKSASMARTGIILFIDSRLHADMEERIRIGLNFNDVNLSPSKLYAYTGLYLSDAKRINQSREEGFVLNEKTVIVIPDESSSQPVRESIITGVSRQQDKNAQNQLQKWDIQQMDTNIVKFNQYDGEGLISPEYCAYINKVLHNEYGMQGAASSLQIRGLPFSKGMLHSVDFHKFICEQLGIESCKDLYIEDAFGIRRNLEDAQIILTQSMFKVYNWIKNPEINGCSQNSDLICRYDGDLMKLYFERFVKYDHALYIGVTDINMSKSARTKLNYQFLNTLALEQNELEQLIKDHLSWAVKSKDKDVINALTETFHSLDESSELEKESDTADTWMIVASRNPAFLQDPKVRGMMKGVRYSLLKDVGKGKLSIKGSNKFLSRDLLALLRFMIGRLWTKNLAIRKEINTVYKKLRQEQLWKSSFFVTDCIPAKDGDNKKRLHLNPQYYYGVLRNPHLSRNEQCALRPYIPKKDSLYVKFFSHLNGVLMVAQNSLTPQILGGADFDGDIVKLVNNKEINHAILRGCYDEKEKYIRTLPIVIIPESEPRIIKLKDNKVDFKTIQDTFSNKIGAISNRSIYLGKREYDPAKKYVIKDKYSLPKAVQLKEAGKLDELEQYIAYLEKREDYTLKCETCTILTGLEIDAAKTGEHPDLSDILEGKIEKDYFIEKKEQIDSLPKQHMLKVIKQPEEAAEGMVKTHEGLSAVWVYGEHRGDVIMSAVDTSKYQDVFYMIDQLPYRLLKELCPEENPSSETEETKTSSDVENVEDTTISDEIKENEDTINSGDVQEHETEPKKKLYRFSFETLEDWRDNVNDPELQKVVIDLIQSYNVIMNISNKVYKVRERLQKSNYAGCINVILTMQYEGVYNNIKRQKIQEIVYEELIKGFGSYIDAEQALHNLVLDRKWPFIRTKEAKMDYLDYLLPHNQELHEESRDILANFSWNGYNLLYYFVKDIMIYFRDIHTELEIMQAEEQVLGMKRDSQYYDQFRKIYEDALTDHAPQAIWKQQIVEQCRSVLKEQFEGQMSNALMYVYALRNDYDKYGNFLWDVFTATEMLNS